MLPAAGDWHTALEPAVREDLRRQRTYRGDMLKDLLRALRYRIFFLSVYFNKTVGTFVQNLYIIYSAKPPSLLLDTTADRALALDANIADLNRITLPEFPCMEDPRQGCEGTKFLLRNFCLVHCSY